MSAPQVTSLTPSPQRSPYRPVSMELRVSSDELELPTFPTWSIEVIPYALPTIAVPYPCIAFFERVIMVGEEQMSLWEKDVIVWLKGSLENPMFKAEREIRSDNPISMAIQIPLSLRCGSSETLLLRALKAIGEAEGEERHALVTKFDEYFGIDGRCSHWKPSTEFNFITKLTVDVKETPSDFESTKPMAARFVVALGLLTGIWIDVCDCRSSPPHLLLDPRLQLDHPFVASQISRFRHDVIWPLFGSTKSFWLKLNDLFHESKPYAYVWPESQAMSIPQLRDYVRFKFPGDETVIKMTYALEAIQGGYEEYTIQLTCDLKSGFKSHHFEF